MQLSNPPLASTAVQTGSEVSVIGRKGEKAWTSCKNRVERLHSQAYSTQVSRLEWDCERAPIRRIMPGCRHRKRFRELSS